MTLTWNPDTCFCEYVVQMVEQGTSGNFTMELVSVILKCSIHKQFGDQGAFSSAFNRMKGQNQINQNDLPKQTEEKLKLKKETTR